MNRFNVRVYGLLFNDEKEVLVTDENRFGIQFTKFPGGGLEFGEGTIECLKREFIEELNSEIEIDSHYYTTDFCQESAFKKTDQLLCIYYKVKLVDRLKTEISKKKFDFKEQEQIFRWMPIADLQKEEALTFPIDIVVAKKLILDFSDL